MDGTNILVSLLVLLVVLFFMRWLVSWWFRVTDILKELRSLNATVEAMAKTQRDMNLMYVTRR